jgi:hypothetical protein
MACIWKMVLAVLAARGRKRNVDFVEAGVTSHNFIFVRYSGPSDYLSSSSLFPFQGEVGMISGTKYVQCLCAVLAHFPCFEKN